MTPAFALRASWCAVLVLGCLLVPDAAHAQRSWSPPVSVTPVGQPSRLPRLAMDGNGNAVATWIREQASGTTARQTQAARLTATGLWAQPVNLYTPVATVAVPGESTDVALNAAGRGAAVWVRATGPAVTDQIVQAAAFSGTSWGTPMNVMPAGAAGVTSPRVGVDSDGNAIAVWVQVLDGFAVVRASRYASGSAWSTPVTVSVADENVTDGVALGVDNTGDAVAAWVSITGGVPTLHAAQFGEAANAWQTPVTIAPVGRSPTVVRLALTRSGATSFVAYRAFDGSHDTLRAARLDTASGTWSAPADVSVPGRDVFDLDIAVDEQGRAFAVWNRFDGTHRTVQTSRYTGSWSSPGNRSVGANTRDVSIDTDAAGNAVAAWTRLDGSTHRVQAAAYALATGQWTAAADVSDASGDAAAPQVRLHIDGTAVVVWQDDTGSPTIHSSRYVSDSAPLLQPATVSGPNVSLAWSPGAGSAPLGYTVVASRTPGGSPAIWLPVGTATSLAVTASPGAYYVRVLALVSGLDVSSNEIEVVVGVGPAPTAPQNLAASVSGSVVTLTWTPPVNIAIAPVRTYYIEAGSAPGISNLAFFPTGNAETMYVTPPVANGSYWVRVRAESVGGLGPATNDLRVIVGPEPPGAPVLSGGATGPGAVLLQWTAPPTPGVPVTGYELHAGSAPGLSNLAVLTLPASPLTFATTGVPPFTYYVRVVPLSAAGPGTPSNEIVVVVP